MIYAQKGATESENFKFQVDIRSISVQKAPAKKTHRLPRHDPFSIDLA